MRLGRIIVVLLAVLSGRLWALADTGDTITVPTFSRELVNSLDSPRRYLSVSRGEREILSGHAAHGDRLSFLSR